MGAACLCEPRPHLPGCEGCKFEIGQRLDRPAILSIGLRIVLDRVGPFGCLGRERFHAGNAQHGLREEVALRAQGTDAALPTGAYCFGRRQFEDVADAFAFQPAQGTAELLGLVADDMRPKLPVRAKHAAILAEALREIEDDGLGEEVELLGQRDQRLPCLGLNVGRIDDGQASASEPLAHVLMQKIEGVARRRLVVPGSCAANSRGPWPADAFLRS